MVSIRCFVKNALVAAWEARTPLVGASIASALCVLPAAAAVEPCRAPAGMQAHREFAELHLDFTRFFRADPDRVIALACGETVAASSVDERARAQIDLGAALVGASKQREAVEVLDRAIAVHEDDPTVDPLAIAALYYQRGNAYRLLNELPRAEADLQIARGRQRAASQERTELYARTLIAIASLLQKQLKVDEAERALDEADSILRQVGHVRSRDLVDVLNERTMIAYGRQDLEKTARHAEAAADLLRSVAGADDAELLEPYATLTAVRSMTGDFEGSVTVALEALRIVDLHPTLGIDARLGIVQNLAATYSAHGQIDKALPFAVQGLRLSEQQYGAGAPAVFRAHLTLGGVYRELGRYGEALRQYDAAGAIDTNHPGTVALPQRFGYLLGRSQLRLELGDVDGARDDLTRAADAMRDQPRLAYWRAWHGRLACKIDTIEKNWAAADAHCKDAQTYQQDVLDPGHWLIVNTFAHRCRAQALGGLPGDACDKLRQRLEAGPALHPVVRATADMLLATIESSRGRADRALDLRLQALSAAEQVGARDPLWSAQYAIASSLAEMGQRSLAIFFGKLSIASIGKMRESMGAERERYERGVLMDKLVVFRHVADWLLDDLRPVEAIETLRLMKVEEMFDYTERAATKGEQVSIAFAPHEVALARAFDPKNAQATAQMTATEVAGIIRRRDDRTITPSEAARLERWSGLAERDRQRRVNELKRLLVAQRKLADDASSPAVPTTTRPNNVATPTNLAPDQADAYLFIVDRHLQLVFVRRDGITRRSIDVEEGVMTRQIAQFLASIASPDFVEPADRSDVLYAWLGEPIDREAQTYGIRRIRLWLDGTLRYVPFAALWDGRHFLLERYEFSYRHAELSAVLQMAASQTASGPVHVAPETAATSGADRTMLAFGVTRPFEGLAALPGVRDELCAIVDGPVTGLDGDAGCAKDGRARGTFAGAGFANASFTEERLRRSIIMQGALPQLRPIGIIHLGTHLSLRPGNIRKSWLLLGDGNHLSLAALQSIDFRAADLVTLSACQSGVAGASDDDGREIEGLPTLLHRRGAKTVVSSLWRIDDRGTARLMRAFYEELRAPGVGIPAALRSAQMNLMQSDGRAYTSPYFWAAFVPSTASD